MKKIITLTLVFIMLLMQSVSAATMYSADGKAIEVDDSEIEAYRQKGWYNGKPVTMYAFGGRTQIVGENDVEINKTVGWYTAKPVIMNSLDGRILVVGEHEVEAYKAVGWYHGIPTKMYAPDGRVITVGKKEVAAYRNVGWYPYPLDRASANIDVMNAVGLTYDELESRYGSINQAFNDLGAAFYKIGNQNFWGAFYNRKKSFVYVLGSSDGVIQKGEYGFYTPTSDSVCVSLECTAGDLFNCLKGSYTLDRIYSETGLWFDNYGMSVMDDNYMIVGNCGNFTITISSANKTVEASDFVHIKAHNYKTVWSPGATY